MRKYLAFALLALALASAVAAAGGVTAFVTLETQVAMACATVGC
jgi:hypothetical protein